MLLAASVCQFVCLIVNMILSDEDKILIKNLYSKGYTAKRLTDEFPEKSWTLRVTVNIFSSGLYLYLPHYVKT